VRISQPTAAWDWLTAGHVVWLRTLVRLMLVALGRRSEDDRDHYANKRLDLGGPLMAGLFRLLFRKLCKELRLTAQKMVRPFPPARRARPFRLRTPLHGAMRVPPTTVSLPWRPLTRLTRGVCLPDMRCAWGRPHAHVAAQVDAGKEINVLAAINEKIVTRGLKYSLATGNWGEQGKAGIRAGAGRVMA
jgi:DNA-directed RNA polymerase beta subunit